MTEREERQPGALGAEKIAAKKQCQQKIDDLLSRRKQIMRELAWRLDEPLRKTQAKGKGGPKTKPVAKDKSKRTAQASKEIRQINEDIKRYKTKLRRLEDERGGMRGSGKKKSRQSGPAKDRQVGLKAGEKIQKADSESASDRESTFDKPKVRKKKRRKKKGGQWVVIWQGGAPQ